MLLMTILERCSTTPLHVEIWFPKRCLEDMKYWTLLKSKAHQITSLILHIDAGTEMNALEIIKQPAPALQRLHINVRPSRNSNLDYKAGIAIRSQLFHYQTPSLRVLELYHLAPPAASPLFSGLTRLRVEGASLYDQDFNTDDLLSILRRCPDLEELELVDSGPRLQADCEERLRHVPRVRLKCLRKLLLAVQTSWVADPSNILHFIIAPGLDLVTLSQAGDLQLRRALPAGLKPQACVDTVRLPCPQSLTCAEFELYNSRSGSLNKPVFAFCLESELPPGEDIDAQFADFIQSWGLTTLERLDIATLAEPKGRDDRFTGFTFLRHLPSLKIISFSGRQDTSGPEHTYVAEFLDNLEGLQDDEGEEPEELMFDSVSFADPERAGRRHVSKALAKLKGYLWRRMDRGASLPRLTLRKCPGVRSSFAQKHLQPLVQHMQFEVWIGMDEAKVLEFLSPTPRIISKSSLAFTYSGSSISVGNGDYYHAHLP